METNKIDINEIKRRGRTAFRTNFLLCVFTALVIALLIEGSTNFFNGMGSSSLSMFEESTETVEGSTEAIYTYMDETTGETYSYTQTEMTQMQTRQTIAQQAAMFIGGHLEGSLGIILKMVLSGMGAFSILFGFLVSNVLEVGCCRFFLINSKRKAYINEVFSYFKKGKYKRQMFIQMYRISYVFCWGLLFIVPGVIKAYQYRLVPYLLADGVERRMEETLQMSKELMEGHKKEAFLMDLSFLGWDIMGVLSLGLLSTFWTNPYKYASRAEFYAEIRRMNEAAFAGFDSTTGNGPAARKGNDPFASYRKFQKKNQ